MAPGKDCPSSIRIMKRTGDTIMDTAAVSTRFPVMSKKRSGLISSTKS